MDDGGRMRDREWAIGKNHSSFEVHFHLPETIFEIQMQIQMFKSSVTVLGNVISIKIRVFPWNQIEIEI